MIESKYFYLAPDKKNYLHYEVIKNIVPKTTLFIHGNLSSNRWWRPLFQSSQLPVRGELAGDIILAEIRGCGRSSDVDPDEVITIPSLAEDFIRLVDVLELSEFNIVGHSTGGSIALVMLSRMTEKIARAVLIDPVGVRGRAFEPPMIKAFQRMRTELNLVAEIMRTTISAPDIDPKFFEDVVVPDAFRAVQVVGLKIAQAFANFNVADQLSHVQNPVLVLHGDQDHVLPLADSQELARLLPNGRLDVLSNTGHCPNLQDPYGLWLRLSQFLQF